MEKARTPSDAEEAAGRPAWSLDLVDKRKKAGLTQEALAEALSVSQGTITDWERGKTKPRQKHWADLNKLLGTDFPANLGREGSLVAATDMRRFYRRPPGATFMDLSDREQFSVFSERFSTAMIEAGFQLKPHPYAVRAYEIWTRVTNISRPVGRSQIEVMLADAIEDEVQQQIALREARRAPEIARRAAGDQENFVEL